MFCKYDRASKGCPHHFMGIVAKRICKGYSFNQVLVFFTKNHTTAVGSVYMKPKLVFFTNFRQWRYLIKGAKYRSSGSCIHKKWLQTFCDILSYFSAQVFRVHLPKFIGGYIPNLFTPNTYKSSIF